MVLIATTTQATNSKSEASWFELSLVFESTTFCCVFRRGGAIGSTRQKYCCDKFRIYAVLLFLIVNDFFLSSSANHGISSTICFCVPLSQVFRPYAKWWLTPLLELVLSRDFKEKCGQGINYFVNDILVTTLSWHSTAIPEVFCCTSFLKFGKSPSTAMSHYSYFSALTCSTHRLLKVDNPYIYTRG
jgi:NUC194 domain